jgi:hypothetical protein
MTPLWGTKVTHRSLLPVTEGAVGEPQMFPIGSMFYNRKLNHKISTR